MGTLSHEAGHALIAELDLKITGREEDVADQLAAYILTYNEMMKIKNICLQLQIRMALLHKELHHWTICHFMIRTH